MLTKKWMCVAVAVAALFVAAAAQAEITPLIESYATDGSTTTWGLATNNPSADDILDASQSTWTDAGETYTSDTGMSISPYYYAMGWSPAALNNGVGQASEVDTGASRWGVVEITIDLGGVMDVVAFNTYTWAGDWAAPRQDQHYTLDSSANGTDWTLVGTVDTYFNGEDNNLGLSHQVGVSFAGGTGGPLSGVRYLRMTIPSGGTAGGTDDFYGEIDVFIPEPATMALLAIGGLAVLRRRRARA